MKLPITIISLIFEKVNEKYWTRCYFLFMDEIEWKIGHHLKDINNYEELIENCDNENIFTILKNKNNKLNWQWALYHVCIEYYIYDKNGKWKIIISILNKSSNTIIEDVLKELLYDNVYIPKLIIKYILKYRDKKDFNWDNLCYESCNSDFPSNFIDRTDIYKLIINSGAKKCKCGLSLKSHLTLYKKY